MTDDRARLGPILRAARTIAVVGLSPDPARPSHGVAGFLQRAGYRILPVRPGGATVLGERSFDTLTDAVRAEGPVDIVNIFRRPDAVPALLPALLAARPKLVWMQLGVHDVPTRDALEAAGIPVVMDRCLMVELPRLVSE
ncbi:MAG: CoA-binding protein [Gemmatimonadetes bacterium]|nr:CoA-binding protein [Gemmatimonadota bacterium]